ALRREADMAVREALRELFRREAATVVLDVEAELVVDLAQAHGHTRRARVLHDVRHELTGDGERLLLSGMPRRGVQVEPEGETGLLGRTLCDRSHGRLETGFLEHVGM